uniref:VASt domain-containing protein n=1 Tax=Schistosoma mansoni TaxID=6183 RepID=A0A3Q0KVC3_SCHMA
MNETQFLSSATETDSNFKSPHLSTSCSHLPVKFTFCEPDLEDSDDSRHLAEVSISNDLVGTKRIDDRFDDNDSKRPVMPSVLGPNVLKNTLSNSFASIPNHIRSAECENKQHNTSKQSCQNNAINSLLTSKTSLSSSSSILGSHKLHQSNQNIPLIGLRSSSNLTISSLSTVQSRHIVESSSTSALSSQNVSKPSRSRPRRFANLYSSLTPSYRTKLEQFRRIFRDTPVDTERLLDSFLFSSHYSCALSKNNNGLLLQGRMYITETWVCFYSKILYEQKIFLAVNEIVAITKEKTARVIPNAIQILYSKNHERFFFTSFASRERSYAILRKVWENCRNHQTLVQINQTMSIDEILQQIRDMYGDYSLAMVEDEEDTDGDAELVPTTFPHRPRTLSDSSLSSQLTGRSKSASLEDVCHSDQPVNLDRSSKCSVLGTTDDELKVVSDADIPFKRVPSFSDPSHFSTIGDEPKSQQLNTIKRCTTPEVKCHLTSGTTPNEVMSDSFQVPHKSVKEKKKRTRKKRLGSHHHDEVSNSKLMQPNYLSTHDPSPPDTSVVSSVEPPITCGPGHDHPGRVYANTDIPLNVNALFRCIFTDSEFFSRFSEHRGTFGMIQSPWPVFKWSSPSECLNQLETSSKIERTITYTLTLKQKLGPRTCTAVEQQTLLPSESISGKRYIIDAKVTNHAVPLSNCFYVVSRYCLLYVNRTTSRLHVSSQVIYEKPVFFGAKSIIENTCHSGLSDFFDTITIKLKEFATNLSLEERLTGGWLTQQRGYLNNITPPLNPSNIQNNSLLIQSVNGNQNNRKLNKADAFFTGNVNSNKVPASRYSDQAKSSIFNSCINDNTNVKKQNKTTLFGSGDMTYLFMRPDRAWLLLVIIGLLLCLFLSMVYNRLVVLEKLAEQFPPLSARDRNHFQDLFGTSPQEDRGSIPIYKDHLASKSPEWARTRLKVMKDLIHLLSKTLIQMQQTLTQVQQGIELLEFPPSNLEDNIKTSMNVKTPTNTDTNCPDTQTKHVP